MTRPAVSSRGRRPGFAFSSVGKQPCPLGSGTCRSAIRFRHCAIPSARSAAVRSASFADRSALGRAQDGPGLAPGKWSVEIRALRCERNGNPVHPGTNLERCAVVGARMQTLAIVEYFLMKSNTAAGRASPLCRPPEVSGFPSKPSTRRGQVQIRNVRSWPAPTRATRTAHGIDWKRQDCAAR